MTAYVVAQISIHDRARYDRYVAGFLPTLKAYGGRLLAAQEQPQVLEGDWDRDKVILLAFPDQAQALAWAASGEYQAIAADRLAASEGPVLLIQGYT
jgi:uncharacterized protein (DUF1330 family)